MPIYEYRCQACGRRFELLHGVGANPPGDEAPCCPYCGGLETTRIMSAPFTPKSKAGDPGTEASCRREEPKDGCVPGECCGSWPDNDDYIKLP